MIGEADKGKCLADAEQMRAPLSESHLEQGEGRQYPSAQCLEGMVQPLLPAAAQQLCPEQPVQHVDQLHLKQVSCDQAPCTSSVNICEISVKNDGIMVN